MTITARVSQQLMADVLDAHVADVKTPDSNHNCSTSNATNHQGWFKTEVVWFNAVGFFGLYIAMFYGLYLAFFSVKVATFLWTTLLMAYAGFSTTIGSHRLFTHRSFTASKGLRIVLIAGQTLAAQNCVWVWVRDHRQHHTFSDTDADPHNSLRGVFFSHVGWLMMRKHPSVIQNGRTVSMSDMNEDNLVMFQKRHYKPLFFLLGVFIPIFIPMYLWEETLFNCILVSLIVRIHLTNNIVWLVNSWAHWEGQKPYDRNIVAVESFWVSLFCLGEGWHNFHHTFPSDYRTSEPGKRPNVSTAVINLLAKAGWASNLKTVNARTIARRIVKNGDGSHPLAGRSEEEIALCLDDKLRREQNEMEEEVNCSPVLMGRVKGGGSFCGVEKNKFFVN